MFLDSQGYQEISRGGFNSGETDLSGIGFENNWVFFKLGEEEKFGGRWDGYTNFFGSKFGTL